MQGLGFRLTLTATPFTVWHTKPLAGSTIVCYNIIFTEVVMALPLVLPSLRVDFCF